MSGDSLVRSENRSGVKLGIHVFIRVSYQLDAVPQVHLLKILLFRDDFSILGVDLTTGKSGFEFCEEYGDNIHRVWMFQCQSEVPIESLLGRVGTEEQREKKRDDGFVGDIIDIRPDDIRHSNALLEPEHVVRETILRLRVA